MSMFGFLKIASGESYESVDVTNIEVNSLIVKNSVTESKQTLFQTTSQGNISISTNNGTHFVVPDDGMIIGSTFDSFIGNKATFNVHNSDILDGSPTSAHRIFKMGGVGGTDIVSQNLSLTRGEYSSTYKISTKSSGGVINLTSQAPDGSLFSIDNSTDIYKLDLISGYQYTVEDENGDPKNLSRTMYPGELIYLLPTDKATTNIRQSVTYGTHDAIGGETAEDTTFWEQKGYITVPSQSWGYKDISGMRLDAKGFLTIGSFKKAITVGGTVDTTNGIYFEVVDIDGLPTTFPYNIAVGADSIITKFYRVYKHSSTKIFISAPDSNTIISDITTSKFLYLAELNENRPFASINNGLPQLSLVNTPSKTITTFETKSTGDLYIIPTATTNILNLESFGTTKVNALTTLGLITANSLTCSGAFTLTEAFGPTSNNSGSLGSWATLEADRRQWGSIYTKQIYSYSSNDTTPWIFSGSSITGDTDYWQDTTAPTFNYFNINRGSQDIILNSIIPIYVSFHPQYFNGEGTKTTVQYLISKSTNSVHVRPSTYLNNMDEKGDFLKVPIPFPFTIIACRYVMTHRTGNYSSSGSTSYKNGRKLFLALYSYDDGQSTTKLTTAPAEIFDSADGDSDVRLITKQWRPNYTTEPNAISNLPKDLLIGIYSDKYLSLPQPNTDFASDDCIESLDMTIWIKVNNII